MFKHFYALTARYKMHLFYLSMMMGLIIIGYYALYEQIQCVTVNITSLQDSFIKETVQQKLSPDEMKAKVIQFSKLLNAAILTLAHDRKMIVLPSEAVIAGAKDETNTVAKYIKERMQP